MSQSTDNHEDPEKQQQSDDEQAVHSEPQTATDAEIEAELLDDSSSELESLQEQLNTANDQLLRLQAEMQNVRRRAERDVESAHKFGLEKFATQLLPVVDNLERALDAIDTDNESQKAVSEGVDLTLKNFLDVLIQFNIESVDPGGEPFDADFHQAVSMVANPDVEPNTVLEVFQKGYRLNGRLMRPAMVVVSTAP